jgi:hypothetical protein
MLAFVYLSLQESGKLPKDAAAAQLIDAEARERAQRALSAKSLMESIAILNSPE